MVFINIACSSWGWGRNLLFQRGHEMLTPIARLQARAQLRGGNVMSPAGNPTLRGCHDYCPRLVAGVFMTFKALDSSVPAYPRNWLPSDSRSWYRGRRARVHGSIFKGMELQKGICCAGVPAQEVALPTSRGCITAAAKCFHPQCGSNYTAVRLKDHKISMVSGSCTTSSYN